MVEVLLALHRWTRRRGYPPTIDELMDQLGSGSRSSLAATIDRLCDRGLLARDYATARSLRLTRRGRVALRAARADAAAEQLPLFRWAREG